MRLNPGIQAQSFDLQWGSEGTVGMLAVTFVGGHTALCFGDLSDNSDLMHSRP